MENSADSSTQRSYVLTVDLPENDSTTDSIHKYSLLINDQPTNLSIDIRVLSADNLLEITERLNSFNDALHWNTLDQDYDILFLDAQVVGEKEILGRIIELENALTPGTYDQLILPADYKNDFGHLMARIDLIEKCLTIERWI